MVEWFPGVPPVALPLPESTPETAENGVADSEMASGESAAAHGEAAPVNEIFATATAESPSEAEAAVPEFEDSFTLRARALNKGDWVEFHYEDGTFRWARLGWVGGVRNTYLFSDQDGMNSFSIGLHRLADKLRKGEAVMVERTSITESAFGKLMGLFKQKLGYA